MNRKQIISVFFLALLLYILSNVLFILSPFLQPIFWGSLLAFAFYPIHIKIAKRLHRTPGFAALFSTLLILLSFVPLVILIAVLAVREAGHLYEWLTHWVENGGGEAFFQKLSALPIIRRITSLHWVQNIDLKGQFEDWILNSAGSIGNFAVKHATLLTKNIISGVINFFLTFFLLFFFLRDGKKVTDFIYEITPLDEESKTEIFKQLSDTFSATIRGQLFTGLAQATILGFIFWVLGLPLPIFFAAITFMAAMIPVFGAATVWVPFVAYLFLTQDFGRGMALLLSGVFGISGIDNILKPLLIGHKTKLPYSLLFLGILGGLQVYGFIGVFLAPVILSLFFVLVRIFQKRFITESYE